MSSAAWHDIRSVNKNQLHFLYTSSKQSENEVKEIISFVITPKGIKYLRINLTKEVQDLYTENYKMLLKEVGRFKQKDIQCFIDRETIFGNTPQIDLHTQCNRNQNPRVFLFGMG